MSASSQETASHAVSTNVFTPSLGRLRRPASKSSKTPNKTVVKDAKYYQLTALINWSCLRISTNIVGNRRVKFYYFPLVNYTCNIRPAHIYWFALRYFSCKTIKMWNSRRVSSVCCGDSSAMFNLWHARTWCTWEYVKICVRIAYNIFQSLLAEVMDMGLCWLYAVID